MCDSPVFYILLHWFSWSKNNNSSSISDSRSTFFVPSHAPSDIPWGHSRYRRLGWGAWKTRIHHQNDLSRDSGQWMGVSNIFGGPTWISYYLSRSIAAFSGESIIFSRYVVIVLVSVKWKEWVISKTPLSFASMQTHNKELKIQKSCRADLSKRALKQISLTFNKYVMKFDFKILYLHKLICLSYVQTCKIKMLGNNFTCKIWIFTTVCLRLLTVDTL